MSKEVCVRFVGFGAEEDEWVNVKKAVRQRSIPLEHSECHKVKVGDLVLCFQVILNAFFWCVLEKASILGSLSKLPM